MEELGTYTIHLDMKEGLISSIEMSRFYYDINPGDSSELRKCMLLTAKRVADLSDTDVILQDGPQSSIFLTFRDKPTGLLTGFMRAIKTQKWDRFFRDLRSMEEQQHEDTRADLIEKISNLEQPPVVPHVHTH